MNGADLFVLVPAVVTAVVLLVSGLFVVRTVRRDRAVNAYWHTQWGGLKRAQTSNVLVAEPCRTSNSAQSLVFSISTFAKEN